MSDTSHDKFIHHESVVARFASSDGARGRFDVIEDEYGPYVSSADAGLMTRWPTVESATTEAERLAHDFDRAFAKPQPITMSAVQADFILRYLPAEYSLSNLEMAVLDEIYETIRAAFPFLPVPE